jgi:hypothetical protein
MRAKRAVGAILTGISTLFFLKRAAAASMDVPDTADFNAAFSGYAAKMVLALLLLGALAYFALKFLPGRLGSMSRGHIKVICAVSLGRDMMYIARLGPQVVAFLCGRTGSTILAKWSAEEWDDYEAARFPPEHKPEEKNR